MVSNINIDNIMPQLIIRHFEQLQPYSQAFEAMKSFTHQRGQHTPDEIWLLQHHDVLTQGQAGKAEHILQHTHLPVVYTDRGGQVTWHGIGQLVVYFLLDLNRLDWNVRQLVDFAEQMMIDILAEYQIQAYAKKDAPGVYVDGCKIGSLGFKIRKGRSYHGFALNVNCDLTGFQTINPCGYAGLEMVRMCDLLNSTPSMLELMSKCEFYMRNKQLYQQVDLVLDGGIIGNNTNENC